MHYSILNNLHLEEFTSVRDAKQHDRDVFFHYKCKCPVQDFPEFVDYYKFFRKQGYRISTSAEIALIIYGYYLRNKR
mgnify:CR=1 FL=1